MIRPNSIHWNMTASTADRVVYLSVMRNLKTYCKKGFCDFCLAAYRFSDYPKSFAKRMIKPYRHVPPFIFDWNDEESVHNFLLQFIKLLTLVYHTRFNETAFRQAYEEFAQSFRRKQK